MFIGETLQIHVKTDFYLNHETLIAERSIKGSIRICTLMNVLLRFMDVERMGGKRWFFRSVEAFYTGHKGSTKEWKWIKLSDRA